MNRLSVEELRQLASRAANTHDDIERRLAISLLLQEAVRSRQVIEVQSMIEPLHLVRP